MPKPSAFWNRIAERYAKQPVADEAAYQRKLQVTRDYLRPDMEVLEFGCGIGSRRSSMPPRVKHIHAVDISSKMLEIARGKAAAGKVGNLTFEQADIGGFSAPERTYDAVPGLSILHLLDNMEDVVAKVHGMLKPGSLFVTSTVCMRDKLMTTVIGLVVPVGQVFGLLPYVRSLTPRQLRDSLTAAGFEIDHYWQPGKGKAVFIVARKAA